ncbi:hypothetical protein LY28_00021 [Ruminiclostridium sufflavum DSM 19573]|uniref:Uncharacterized protein n=1 Tax=Ruminiclostridium sufflavum DSM 19573 TaxID=1121337 RepID=A0A318XPB3_9FIRM|nr:hypothetical protein [Ruminiclostridium sufflavum]PYG90141.1 hypothetical protein LY28_00021 [Ruminiclostridium sufflavum DSM 19573]
MKLPFPDWILVTPVKVYQETTGENGISEELIFDGKCCYDDKTKQVLDSERRLVTLAGKVILKGDIYPDKEISGYVMFGEKKNAIFRTARPYNPDGSVFSTELELI